MSASSLQQDMLVVVSVVSDLQFYACRYRREGI